MIKLEHTRHLYIQIMYYFKFPYKHKSYSTFQPIIYNIHNNYNDNKKKKNKMYVVIL